MTIRQPKMFFLLLYILRSSIWMILENLEICHLNETLVKFCEKSGKWKRHLYKYRQVYCILLLWRFDIISELVSSGIVLFLILFLDWTHQGHIYLHPIVLLLPLLYLYFQWQETIMCSKRFFVSWFQSAWCIFVTWSNVLIDSSLPRVWVSCCNGFCSISTLENEIMTGGLQCVYSFVIVWFISCDAVHS